MVGIVIAIVAILAVSAIAAIFLDLSSYMDTGSQTLNSTGAATGRALVVYDPGLSGSPKSAAHQVAVDLQAKGYDVDLAGVRSNVATNTSGYDIIVAGGPMYFGKATSSIEGFIRSLTPQQQTRLGVFVTTGSSTYVNSDFSSLQQQLESATSHQVTIQMVLDGNVTQNCANLASNMMP